MFLHFARQGTILSSHRVIGIATHSSVKLNCASDLHYDDSRCRTARYSLKSYPGQILTKQHQHANIELSTVSDISRVTSAYQWSQWISSPAGTIWNRWQFMGHKEFSFSSVSFSFYFLKTEVKTLISTNKFLCKSEINYQHFKFECKSKVSMCLWGKGVTFFGRLNGTSFVTNYCKLYIYIYSAYKYRDVNLI